MSLLRQPPLQHQPEREVSLDFCYVEQRKGVMQTRPGEDKHPSGVRSRWESLAFLGRGACMHLCASSKGAQRLFFLLI